MSYSSDGSKILILVGFVIAMGNFEGTFYRYAKRYQQTQDLGPADARDHPQGRAAEGHEDAGRVVIMRHIRAILGVRF